MLHGYEAVIGLEVHVQLLTETKMFCRCANRFGAAPNTLVCPVCLGYPGTLPVLNRQAVELAVRLALALGCDVHPRSVFARKNYFYPDLPKGYQISQYDRPLAEGGHLPLSQHDKAVRLERLHMEEDAGKLLHDASGQSRVDFNRCGVPLVEIVSRPELSSAAEAADSLQTLHQVLLYTGTSAANLEEGSLRCDANVSVRRPGEPLGTKTEVKNLNSFRNVARAIEHEIGRQIGILESGGRVVQETRGFDAATGATHLLRSKEEAHDYRYFPEPDLPVLVLTPERIEAARAALPELPWEKRSRLVSQYGLPPADAGILASSRELADYFEAAAKGGNPKTIANWVLGEVLRVGLENAIPPERLSALVSLIDAGRISNSAAKEVFAAIRQTGEEPAAAVERLGLGQVSDAGQIERWIEEVLAANPAQAEQVRSGKDAVLGFLVGQVMKRSGGRADPKLVQTLLRQALAQVSAP
ncbi:MAG TPA: Asp-tRNA(Asn)/Glu-tRNA(Gln) amidotransferase subunit GatB [Thermoanaerobaculia bacterium]|jgi:aspartyl-tRNA(Asn)/glutamyl-tRNA(Gln) amidotransferase subunit B|nr:Asp-tRNA(Asn)/Glu-tRNA(Gln) amidotransferase subunit GatB [Thermoanaerobaculia bacterium]